MRLTGYEIKKLMTQIPLWIAFIGLFVGNLFLLFMIQKKEAAYVYVYQQKDQYIAFCEGNEQADELGFYEADLEEQKRYLDSYRGFCPSVYRPCVFTGDAGQVKGHGKCDLRRKSLSDG